MCERYMGNWEQSENVDQQGNILIFNFSCIKKDN